MEFYEKMKRYLLFIMTVFVTVNLTYNLWFLVGISNLPDCVHPRVRQAITICARQTGVVYKAQR